MNSLLMSKLFSVTGHTSGQARAKRQIAFLQGPKSPAICASFGRLQLRKSALSDGFFTIAASRQRQWHMTTMAAGRPLQRVQQEALFTASAEGVHLSSAMNVQNALTPQEQWNECVTHPKGLMWGVWLLAYRTPR